MALKDNRAPEATATRFREICSSDERAKHISNDLAPQQLRELSESAIADALLRRHRKLREFIVQIDQLIDATVHFQKSLWGRS
jgi:ribosomal protein L16 Arg81 hydroxylase